MQCGAVYRYYIWEKDSTGNLFRQTPRAKVLASVYERECFCAPLVLQHTWTNNPTLHLKSPGYRNCRCPCIEHKRWTLIKTNNLLSAWQTNQRVKRNDERERYKIEGQTSKWPFCSRSEAYQIYYNQSALIGSEGYDKTSRILVTTVTPVAWRGLCDRL